MRRVVEQLLLKKLDGREGGRDGDRVSSESRGVRAGWPGHQLGSGNCGAEWHSAGDSFGESDDVGHEPKMFGREHLAGAAHAALDFVSDQQDVVFLSERL